MKPKLAVIVSHPIQYFSPVYRIISDVSRIDSVVIYFSDAGATPYFDKTFMKKVKWDIDLLSGYRHIILEPGKSVDNGFLSTYSGKLCDELNHENPDVILLYGYAYFFNWSAICWAKRHHKKIIYFSDSELLRPRSKWKNIIKQPIVRYFFSNIDMFLTSGDNNEAYLQAFGVNQNKFHRCPLSVDIKRLCERNETERNDIRKNIRQKFGIGKDAFVVLFVGKLTDGKRPLDLIKAVSHINQQENRVVALFVGAGTLKDKMQEACKQYSMEKSVCLAGFVNQREIIHYYMASDVLVIPSEIDAHPLVATEAAALGLPLIVSDQVGCIGKTDVAQPNHNALIYPCGDIDKLSYAIQQLKDSPEKRRIMCENSKVIAETQDISVAASAIENAVLSVCR